MHSDSLASSSFLENLAVHCSLHADAVEFAVDEIERVLLQISQEDAAARHLESDLAELIEKQQRVHDVAAVVARSHRERGVKPKGVRRDHAAAATGSKSTPMTEADTDEMDTLQRDLDEAVELGRALLKDHERLSLRRRFRRLQSAYHRARQVNLVEELKGQECEFRFPSEMEELWGEGEGIVVPSELPSILASAVGRVTWRYHDALTLLKDTLDRGSSYLSLSQVRSCSSYASLLSADDNLDAGMVESLQKCLALKGKETVARPLTPIKQSGTMIGSDFHHHALSSIEYACLPLHWNAIAALCCGNGPAAPPFTFCDLKEHQALIRLRVEFQLRLAKLVMAGLPVWKGSLATKEAVVAHAQLTPARGRGDTFAWRTVLEEDSDSP